MDGSEKAGVCRKPGKWILFAVLMVLYIAAVFITPIVSRSDQILKFGQIILPVSALAGVITSFANIVAICLAVFYGKHGFIFVLSALVIQIPMWVRNAIAARNIAPITGLFISLLTVVAIILIRNRDRQIDAFQKEQVKHLTEQQKQAERLFEQTATALVTAIDAKDVYSHGHSIRVAEYSERIARMMGKGDEECRKVYYAGLLHDVGKIGITDAIITKNGRLNEEEYAEIRKHPVLGNQILSSISDYPYISIAAHYHHERYDGKGYPDGLKGNDIPEIARIVSVADAYDAMSSNRSYRRAIPQQIIREEIVSGAGTQFDPDIAMIMRHMIDRDADYHMKERETVRELGGNNEMRCDAYRSEISDGIIVWKEITKIHLSCRDKNPSDGHSVPAIILFDSLDARVHDDPETIRNLNYFEYCEIWMDGKTINHGVRAIKTEVTEYAPAAKAGKKANSKTNYDIETVKCKDHVLIRIDDGQKKTEITIALPDSSRFAYTALTGKDCIISDVSIQKELNEVPEDYISRIAEEISYIDGPEGDIPNVQVDSIRSASSAGIPVADQMRITFHTMSLPTARLIWHCPYVVLFCSEDGKVNGKGYREYAVVRLDGENGDTDDDVSCRIIANREEKFRDWNAWKAGNKEGYDCAVLFTRDRNRITVSTANLGLSVKGIIELSDELTAENREVYTALTGDQCALTNIRIQR